MKSERVLVSRWYRLLQFKLWVAGIFGWRQRSVFHYVRTSGRNYYSYAVRIGRLNGEA